MKDKIALYIVLTMVALLGCLGMAEAQDTQDKITSQVHETGSGALPDAVTPFAVNPGWYYVHAVSCSVYSDGVTSWFYIYLREGFYLFTTNLTFEIAITPACQTGNLMAFYLFNTSGNWNQVIVYPFK